MCVCLLSPAREGERTEILGRWSLLGLQLKNLNEGFNTKKQPTLVLLGGIQFLLSNHLRRRVTFNFVSQLDLEKILFSKLTLLQHNHVPFFP